MLVVIFFLLLCGRVNATDLCSVLFSSDASIVTNSSSASSVSPNVIYKEFSGSIESLAAKIHALRNAQYSIDLAIYRFRGDRTGKIFLKELMAALDRGVRVRILVDGAGTTSLRTFMARDPLESLVIYSRKENVLGELEVRYAMSFLDFRNLWRSTVRIFAQGLAYNVRENLHLQLNQRLHDKGLLIDSYGKSPKLFIGGRNIGDEYSGLLEGDGLRFWDLDVLIQPSKQAVIDGDEITWDYKKLFEMLMYEAPSRQLSGKIFGFFPNLFYSKDIKSNLDMSIKKESPELAEAIEKLEQNEELENDFTASRAELVSQFVNFIRSKAVLSGSWYKSEEEMQSRSIVDSLEREMSQAQKLIEIVTPYPIFPRRTIKKIKSILITNRQLEVRLYANSRLTTDSPFVQLYFEKIILPKLFKINKDPKINGRLKIFSFQGGGEDGPRLANHSKVVRFDQLVTFVTTSNLDGRSSFINSESGVYLRDESVNEGFSSHISFLQEHSKEITSKRDLTKKSHLKKWKAKLYRAAEFIFAKLGIDRQL